MTRSNFKNLDFDIKMVRIFALIFLIYGVKYWLEIGAFLVPLPLVYYLVPIAAIVMLFRTLDDWRSFIMPFIAFVVVKDVWINVSPIIVEPLLLFSILLWLFWGSSFLWYKKYKTLKMSKLFGLSQFLILTPMTSLSSHFVFIGMIISLVISTIFIQKNIENKTQNTVLRTALLIQLIYILYSLQAVAYWQVG